MVNTTQPRNRTLWLIAAVLAVAGVVLLYPPAGPGEGTSTVTSPRQPNPAPDGPADDVTSRSRAAVQQTTEPHAEPAGTSSAGQPEPWLAAATAYAGAFTAPVDREEWVAGLAPWVTPHLVEQYELTGSGRRPRGAVDSVETITPGDYSAHVAIAYDTGLVLNVRVANGPDGWRVTYVEPVSRP